MLRAFGNLSLNKVFHSFITAAQVDIKTYSNSKAGYQGMCVQVFVGDL